MWPPEKVNPALDTLRQEVVEEIADVLREIARKQSGAAKDILILQAERRRNDGLKLRRTKPLDGL